MKTTALTQSAPKLSALNLMASKFSVEPDKLLGTLKATVFKNASNEELLALVVVANTYGLNPLTKEIYAFPAKGGGIAPIVSIDGWIRMTNDHPQFDGMDLEVEFSDDGKPFAATCKIYRKDRTHATTITEYFAECYRNTDPWKQCPARMLRHKALIQAARIAFGFSGIYDEDEGKDVAMRNVTPQAAVKSKVSFALPKEEAAELEEVKETQAAPAVESTQDEIPY
jgi:phage recombination protein Bet